MLFRQSAAQAMKKRVVVTHFTTKIVRTYLYITCNKKILFVKKYFSLLWVFTDFSILLFYFLNINTAIGLLDFTMLRPILAWRAFLNL
jgi:hypothetical protein